MLVTFLDRLITWAAPQWGANRALARLKARHFEAASFGRRTDGYSRRPTDANAAASGQTLSILRSQARDLVRNNPWAGHGLERVVGNTVGWGIKPRATGRGAKRVQEAFKLWGESTQCDAAGRTTFAGLQWLAMRTIVESGEVLIRRRMRRPADGLAIPMQLQVLEPDFIDSSKDGVMGVEGGPIVQGVEFNGIGQRVAYWLFEQHPGGRNLTTGPVSRRIPADGILHVYRQERPGQVRGPSWFASVDIRLHEFDEFEDATLVKQKIAACLAAFVTDLDGQGGPLALAGTDSATGQPTDNFEPGAIISLPAGKQVTIANPPSASDHTSYSATALRGVAAGLDISYEDLTGDYSQVNYSSARMSRLASQTSIHNWRWNMLIPQFCAPAWSWMLDAMILAGEKVENAPAKWQPPPATLLDPDKEGTANQRLVRNGAITWHQMIAESGEDPDEQLDEIEAFNKEIDRRGITLDCDPRNVTAAGMKQLAAGVVPAPVDDTASTAADDSTDTADDPAAPPTAH